MLDWQKLNADVASRTSVEEATKTLLVGVNEAISDARNACTNDTYTQNTLDGLQQRLNEEIPRLVVAVKHGTVAEDEHEQAVSDPEPPNVPEPQESKTGQMPAPNFPDADVGKTGRLGG